MGEYLPSEKANISEDMTLQPYRCENLVPCIVMSGKEQNEILSPLCWDYTK